MANDARAFDQSLQDSLRLMASTFDDRGVRYALIGGMAISYRSQPRFTKDVDILLSVPQIALPGLLEQLQREGFDFDLTTAIRGWTQDHMTVLEYKGVRIDWLKPIVPAYDHVLQTATTLNWTTPPLRVASVEGLMLLKLLAFRERDQMDIKNLIAASDDNLDLAWIQSEWQSVENVNDPRMQKLLEWIKAQRSTAGA